MADNSRAVNRVFTRKVICDLIENGRSDVFDYVVKRYIDDPSSKNHGQLISEIYAHLNKQQRNEYFYMNTLLNKLLCGIHNVNTTSAFSQVRIGHSIADFVMINGEGRVYEIKSDLDNFDRLYDQLRDYYRAFSKVSVLVSIHELEKSVTYYRHLAIWEMLSVCMFSLSVVQFSTRNAAKSQEHTTSFLIIPAFSSY